MKEPRTFSAKDYWTILRDNRSIRLVWLAGFVSMTADWFHRVALHALIVFFFSENWEAALAGELPVNVDEGAALLWTTFAFQAQMLPSTVFSPLIGVTVDRFSRRSVMIAADAFRAVLALLFVLLARPEFLWLMILLEVPLAVGAGFFDTAQKALLPDLVEKDELVAANGVIQANWGVTAGLGALLGGVLVATFGPETAFALNSATFLASLAIIWRVRAVEPHLAERARRDALTAEERSAEGDSGGFLEGARYIAKRKPLVALLSAKPAWALTGGMILTLHTLMGSTVYENWGKPALGVGLLHWARGTGGLIGMLLAPMFFPAFKKHLFKALALVFLIYGVDYCVVASVSHVLTASLLLTIGTMLSAQLWVVPAVILQQTLPASIRGRVFAIDHGLSLVFLGLSGFAAWILRERFGLAPRNIALIAGAGLFAVGVAYAVADRFISIDWSELEREAAAAEAASGSGAGAGGDSLADSSPALGPVDPEFGGGASEAETASEAFAGSFSGGSEKAG